MSETLKAMLSVHNSRSWYFVCCSQLLFLPFKNYISSERKMTEKFERLPKNVIPVNYDVFIKVLLYEVFRRIKSEVIWGFLILSEMIDRNSLNRFYIVQLKMNEADIFRGLEVLVMIRDLIFYFFSRTSSLYLNYEKVI